MTREELDRIHEKLSTQERDLRETLSRKEEALQALREIRDGFIAVEFEQKERERWICRRRYVHREATEGGYALVGEGSTPALALDDFLLRCQMRAFAEIGGL